jgi:hypothetical protein
MPQVTSTGAELVEHIAGFKLFLSVTEAARLKFFNAPDKTPEQFEKYLPYAIALEVEKEWAAQHEVPETKNARCDAIQMRISEHNPESWRIAIIEADIMLDETLINAGYVGQSLGEKLRSANTTSFTTLQDAWEAHKVRNEIAHVGSDFVLTQRTAQETLVRFERVFREFGVI